uniref:Aquaporin 11 n=2 Tax=Nothobranchius rachovii TaxID=451742 RepID=A0A1A8NVT7_9TELE
MDADLAVSMSVLVLIVLLSHVTLWLLLRTAAVADTGYAVELACTFQLCCCSHELRLLSEVGGIHPHLARTLTYLASVVHGLTFRGGIGNPCGLIERMYHARLSGGCALRRIACQFAAAILARAVLPVVWGLGLSGLHVRQKMLGFRCISQVHATLLEATAVELACAFAVQTVVTHTQALQEKYRVHAVAAIITTVAAAGGSVTGAVSNPALAFSTQFLCSGTSFLENCVVFWLGPVLGTLASVLLSDKLSQVFSPAAQSLYLPLQTKKRT